jgi:hypothetical protein
MSMDDPTRSALIRGVTAFVVVLSVGSAAVYASGRLDRETGAAPPSPSPSVTSPPPAQGVATPEAWLAWVPGGLPDGFVSQMTTIPAIVDATTATADIAWLTTSTNSRGALVDQPSDPYMIPIDTTGVEQPAFASFLQPPERRLVAGLERGQGVLSESEAKLRHLDVGSTLTFSTGKEISIVGTLPDVLMGGYELLVGRSTGEKIGVTHERYALLDVRPYSHVTSEELARRLEPYLPLDAPYPHVEVRAPGETKYLRANDREAPPLVLKERFGEFTAYPDPQSAKRIKIDRSWLNTHIASEDLPVLGTVQCNNVALDLFRRAMDQLRAKGNGAAVTSVGACWVPIADATDPDGPLTGAPFGASIEIDPGSNPPGSTPEQSPALVAAMARWGFGWAGRDAYQQGALFRYHARSVARD